VERNVKPLGREEEKTLEIGPTKEDEKTKFFDECEGQGLQEKIKKFGKNLSGGVKKVRTTITKKEKCVSKTEKKEAREWESVGEIRKK